MAPTHSNSHSTDRDDAAFGRLPERLAVAFDQQAERFEPSNDAYARLAEAVNQQAPATGVDRVGGWFRPALATLAVIGIAGVGALALQSRNGTPLDTAAGEGSGSEVADPADAVGSGPDADETSGDPLQAELVEDPSPEAVDGDEDMTVDDAPEAVDADVVGPVTASAESAADAYLTAFGFDYSRLEIEDDRVVAYGTGEGGVGEYELTRIEVVESDGRFVATGSDASSVAIDDLQQIDSDGDGRPDLLRVTGSGQGFEATLGVRVITAVDARVLHDHYTGGGQAANQPFEADVPVTGAERAWVVITSSGGADVAEPFAARQVTWVGAADPTDHTVIRIEADDPDGGLVVRSGPGVASERTGVLPGGIDGVRRDPIVPVAVGTDVWWRVTAPDGTAGWVNSAFLAANGPIDVDELRSVGQVVAETLLSIDQLNIDQLDPAFLPLPPRGPVSVGLAAAPQRVDADDLSTVAGWNRPRTITLPGEYDGPFEGSLLDYSEVGRWRANGTVIEPFPAGPRYVYGGTAVGAERYFGSLPAVVITADDTETPWTRTIVYVETTPVDPVIVGIVVEYWVP